MKSLYLTFIAFFLMNCSKKEENYDLFISNSNYQLAIENGEFKIDWYKNYKSVINFSKSEKEKIYELLSKYHLETLNGERHVYGKQNLIMPNFNDVFTLKKDNLIKFKIIISSQVNLKESKLNKSEIDIYNFKEELFKLLRENKDFQKNMDTLEVAQKSVKRLFL
jgi:hypothetical protein